MAEQTDQIQQHIQSKRAELGQNFEELENKVKSATDWHTYFEQYPMAMLGLSLGGGLLLSMMMGSGRSKSLKSASGSRNWEPNNFAKTAPEVTRQAVNETRDHLTETIDTVKGALIGLVTSKARDLLSEAMPGFREHYDQVERTKSRGPLSSPTSETKPVTM